MTLYVIQKCAMSLDGYIDDTSPKRLLLSNDEDFARVDQVRASCDAILVGAGTIRADNPRLLVRSAALREERVARGLPPNPIKVTITSTGDLDPTCQFFTAGDTPRIVYCPEQSLSAVRGRLGNVAEVAAAGDNKVDLRLVLEDLHRRGVRRLLVEGGSSVGSDFLQGGFVDELQVSIAPFFVGEANAPKFARPGAYLHNPSNRMTLTHVEQVGDVAVLTWRLKRSDAATL